jgi:DNA (cytosine-5)-methyltransferase 3A
VILVSPFNGFGGASQAVKELGITPYKTYISEIDKFANIVAMENHPDSIQLGDITQIKDKTLLSIKDEASKIGGVVILIGGSPCQGFSLLGRRKGSSTECGIKVDTYEKYTQLKNENFAFNGQSYLFWEYIRLKKILNPDFFLLENVKITKEWLPMFNQTLGVKEIRFNSNLVSAQNRDRWYWTNIPQVEERPKCDLVAKDILDEDATFTELAPYFKRNWGKTTRADKLTTIDKKAQPMLASMCKGNAARYILSEDRQTMHKYSPEEAERLQTLPVGYTNAVSTSQRLKMIGNGYTIKAISHLIQLAFK